MNRCERWAQDVYFQFFCGEKYFQPLPCDRTNLERRRQALGERGVEGLLATTIAAVQMKAEKPAEFERVIVDTTVQETAIAYPADSRLLEAARARLLQLAQRAGLVSKQTYEREGKRLRRRAGGYAHAKQFRLLRRVLKAGDAETKFQFLNSHLSLNWPPGKSWPSGVEDVLPLSLASARDSFAFHIQDVTKDALKTLGDLRKGLQEEVAKTQAATRDLVSSLRRDLDIAGIALVLKLPSGIQMPQHVLDWIVTVTAIVLPVSLCITGGTNWRFNRLTDVSRTEWKPKLYGFVEPTEWKRIVEKPISRGRHVYYLTLPLVAPNWEDC